jgi:hypothetical protein
MQIHHSLIKDIEDLDHSIHADLHAIAKGKLSEKFTTQLVNNMLNKSLQLIETLQKVKLSIAGDDRWQRGGTSIDKLIDEALHAEGAQHKQYYLHKIAEMLGVEVDPEDKGVAP